MREESKVTVETVPRWWRFAMLGSMICLAVLIAVDIMMAASSATTLKKSISQQLYRTRASVLQGIAEEMVQRTERIDFRLSELERRVEKAEASFAPPAVKR